MNDGFVFAGAALAVVAAVALALRRRQTRSILEDWAARHGWSNESRYREELVGRLQGAALMQIGHSRRVLAVVEDPRGVQLFEYACETGLDNQRQSHRWIGVTVPFTKACDRATISTEPWVLAAACHSTFRTIVLGAEGCDEDRAVIAAVEDETAWSAVRRREVGARLSGQPRERSWEVHFDRIIGYQPVPLPDDAVADLVSTTKELAKMIDG